MSSVHNHRTLRVCFFGTYDSRYPGNAVLIEGLRGNGVEVMECHVPLWETTPIKDAEYFGLWSTVRLAGRFAVATARLLTEAARLPRCDVVIAGFNGYLDLPLAKLVARGWSAKLVFNPMMSIYDTLVLDRRHFAESSAGARLILQLERALYKLPDAILLDSRAHYRFFVEQLKCPWAKFRQLWFGVDERIFRMRRSKPKDGRFRLLFYGKYQPLQGVVHIVEAAKRVESDPDIVFSLIGHGPTWPEVQQRARELKTRNIEFVKWVDFDKLPDLIARADVCLGIFGTSGKVSRCMPNKVVQALAMGRPVITGYTDAMGELLRDGEHVVFCQLGDPEGLAAAIIRLKQDRELRCRIAQGGHELFCERLSPLRMGALARKHLEELVTVD